MHASTRKGGTRVMAASYLVAVRKVGRDARLYLLTSGLMGFAFWGGLAAVLTNLYLLRLGYGSDFIGLYNACGGFGYGAFALPAGWVGRRLGSRQAMILGLSMGAVGGTLVPLAESGPAEWRIPWLLISNLTLAAGQSFYSVNSSPFLMAATGPEERNHAFSFSSALGPLSAFIGSVSAGFLPGLFADLLQVTLAHSAPYRYPLFIAAAALVPAALAIVFTHPSEESVLGRLVGGSGPIPWSIMLFLGCTLVLRTPAESVARTFFNVYMDQALRQSTALIGSVAALGQLAGGAMALAAPLMMARLGAARSYAAASLVAALSLWPLALVPRWEAAGLGFIGVMAATSLSFPIMNVYSMLLTPPRWRASVASVVGLANGVSFVGVSLGGGYLIQSAGFPSLFLIASGLAIAATLFFWLRAPREQAARSAA